MVINYNHVFAFYIFTIFYIISYNVKYSKNINTIILYLNTNQEAF
jgi:hypothetical protein